MKVLIKSLTFLFGTSMLVLAQGNETAVARKAAIQNKLQAIHIENFKVNQTSLEESIDLLRQRCIDLDSTVDPAKKGVNFIIITPYDIKSPHTPVLVFRDASAEAIIQKIATAAGATLDIGEYAVFIRPKDSLVPLSKALPKNKATDFGDNFIIPRIDFKNTSLQDAVDFIQVGRMDRELRMPQIAFDSSADPKARIKELNVKNVPFTEALRLLAMSTGHQLEADDERFTITK